MYQIQGINKKAIAVLIASLALAACGGGSDDDNSSTTTTTTANSSSSAATSSAASSAATSSAASSSAASSSAASSAAASSAATSSAASVTTVAWIPTRAEFSTALSGVTCSSGNQTMVAGTYTVGSGAVTVYSTSTKLRIYDSADTSTCASAGGTVGTLAVNFNGSALAATAAVAAVGDTLDPSTAASAYIKLPYSSAKTTSPSITLNYSYSASSTNPCSQGQIIVVDASTNKVLNADNICANTAKTSVKVSTSATVGTAGGIYVLFSRGTDGGGGIRVWEIDSAF